MTPSDPGATGRLYVVATPIGNLGDISPRAQQVLRDVSLIAAEDTRVTRKLLAHFDIHTPITSCHEHSAAGKLRGIAERLAAGESVALTSDAGTPGISDPGAALVRAALEVGAVVVPIPGPSALTAALSASGLDTARFLFEGFLPRKRGERRRTLEALRPFPHTLVFYESPERLPATLEALREHLGDRPCAVARELTKHFEEFVRGSLSEVEAHFRQVRPRGECVVMVAGAEPARQARGEEDLEPLLRELLEGGLTVRDAARTAADKLGVNRKEAYSRALELAQGR